MNRLNVGSMAVTTALFASRLLYVGATSVRSVPSKTSTCVTSTTFEPEVVADGFDQALGPELVDAAGPANQEFADVFERDRVLLARSGSG